MKKYQKQLGDWEMLMQSLLNLLMFRLLRLKIE